MNVVDVHSHRQKLESELRIAQQMPFDDPALKQVSKYLCVASTGYFEKAVSRLLIAYVQKRSPKEVGSFADAQLGRLINVKPGRLCSIVRSFDPAWEKELESLDGGRPLESLMSLYANRDLIAHGGNGGHVGVSIINVANWLASIQKIVDFLRGKVV